MSYNTTPITISLPSGGVVMVDSLPSRNEIEKGKYRQVERSAWHRVARRLLDDQSAKFEYNELGAPQIIGSNLHISVSHSSQLVAVIISPNRCAIDIESLSRNFKIVASRYISPTESSLSGDNPHQKAILWSIKECLYKYAGRKELNLTDDLRVTSLTEDLFVGSIPPHSTPIHGRAITLLNHSLAFIG